jgi:hypothetical protein
MLQHQFSLFGLIMLILTNWKFVKTELPISVDKK